MPRGGSRIGAGRKRKPREDNGLQARVLQHPSSQAAEAAIPMDEPLGMDDFAVPDALSVDERNVWLRQAPLACGKGTLTKASALSFERYCRVVVLEGNESKSSGMGGPKHIALLKQVNAYELQFMLTAAGKPLADVSAKKRDLDDEFFGEAHVAGR